MKNMSKLIPNFFKKTLVFTLLFVSVYATSGVSNAFATTVSTSTECVAVESLGDSQSQYIGNSPELSASNIIDNAGLSVGGQKEYQVWETKKSETVIKITFLDGYTAAGDVFGYYEKGNLNSFVPLFKNGSGINSTYSVSQATPGDTFTVTMPEGDFGFAVHSQQENDSYFRASENSLNENGKDHMIAYNAYTHNNPNLGVYVLGFEDLPMSISDKDYNDIVVKVEVQSCETACVENANVSIVNNLPETVTPGQTYSFKIRVDNTGDTKWYHGSYFKLVSTGGNLSINPTYGHLPSIIYPGGSAEWTFQITASTTPGEYSNTLQMIHKAGAEYRDANYVECAPAPSTDVLFGNSVKVKTIVSTPTPVNQAPVITLVGSNPITVVVGNTYSDPGATALDNEDGDITSNIIATSTVNTSVVGSYTVTYNVSDSQGLPATPVTRTVEVIPFVNPHCVSGNELTFAEFNTAVNAGLISFNIATNTENTLATFSITNQTNCKAPISLSVYKVYDTVLSNQEFFDGTGLVHSTSSTAISVDLPNCMAQIDAWYGLHPETLLDSNPYAYPNVPGVIAYKFLFNNNNGYANAEGDFCDHAPENTPPVITLVGANPATVNVGETYTDPGATAQDLEDGNITDDIVVSGTVNTAVAGSYTITYNVADSQGLTATPVSRTVNVLEPTPSEKGKITFCLILGDEQNTIATTSAGLPSGSFSIDLATSTSFATSTINSKTWNTQTFSPNTGIILSQDDADCVSFGNLELGGYFYSELSVSGSLWNTPKYSDQLNQPVNNVFDLFAYSPELFNSTSTDDSLRNQNADGHIILDSNRKERTLILYNKYSPAPQCVLPSVTSSLTASAVVGQTFSYTLTASSTPATTTLSVATSTLPTWLSYATTTNALIGTPTQTGEFEVTMYADNTCGTDTQILKITVASAPGGGGSPAVNIAVNKTSDKSTVNVGDTVTYTITVVNNGPNNATGVSVTDNLSSDLNFVSATSTLGTYSTTTGMWTIGSLNNTASTTLTIVTTIKSGAEGKTIPNTAVGTSTENDPDSANNTSTINVVVNNPVTPPPACTSNCGGGGGGGGGGNGPIVGSFGGSNGPIVPPVVVTPPTSCYYLYDYLRKDFNNNPVEVRKLQVFLRDLEGFTNVQITGVYDDQTIVALDAFQNRYAGDILTPWGHTAPTSYTYILTKKKVNEIYCKMAFPVTAQQQIEIDTYRNFLLGLQNAGITVPSEGFIQPVESTPVIDDGIVGSTAGSKPTATTTNGLSTLAGISSTTQSIAEDLVANVLSGGKRLANYIGAFFTWPFGSVFDRTAECVLGFGPFGWFNLLLILVIIVISYLWYRERKNNKKIDIINKEIDLE